MILRSILVGLGCLSGCLWAFPVMFLALEFLRRTGKPWILCFKNMNPMERKLLKFAIPFVPLSFLCFLVVALIGD